MTTFKKLTVWGVQSDEQLKPGDTVTVTLKSGATKQVTISDQLKDAYGKHVYSIIADND